MANNSIYLITNNKGKWASAERVFQKYGFDIKQLKEDFYEIQADTSLEIAKHTALTVAKERNLTVIREDHSLIIEGLGIPGPYTKFIEKQISPEKLLEILSALNITKGYFILSAVLARPDGSYKEYSYNVDIKFSSLPKGDSNQRWDRVLMFPNEERTFAEFESGTGVWDKNFEAICKDIIDSNKK